MRPSPRLRLLLTGLLRLAAGFLAGFVGYAAVSALQLPAVLVVPAAVAIGAVGGSVAPIGPTVLASVLGIMSFLTGIVAGAVAAFQAFGLPLAYFVARSLTGPLATIFFAVPGFALAQLAWRRSELALPAGWNARRRLALVGALWLFAGAVFWFSGTAAGPPTGGPDARPSPGASPSASPRIPGTLVTPLPLLTPLPEATPLAPETPAP